jgi:hypothetical protein
MKISVNISLPRFPRIQRLKSLPPLPLFPSVKSFAVKNIRVHPVLSVVKNSGTIRDARFALDLPA